jgi:aerobic-type carbon monoxide dehydrogenase small subunit (CoxS/CutS family)
VAVNTRHIRLTINGSPVELDLPVDRLLIDLLRNDLGLTGTKEGCGVGMCGICSVFVDGELNSACILPAVTLDGSTIETVESLEGADGTLSPLQDAFIRRGGFQCGICTAGQLMAATAMMREIPRPCGRAQIGEWMNGNLCRCTGYEGIYNAIAEVAAEGSPA